ncbi:HMGL-like-domain-containing protein [Sodiomyces alkalinus F11]|uniref:HMGL-like-domain-containing protein n=1 Tax=Sodiomyces alkalinus (strain CBS 110278 / VKM F-3762 / F11) TaxID=1314773 RepID=A0A3N2PIR9_SODAK|nr:HMGL-like-domain-containing protein [Sodiomyces alkalinus F11]ROT34447.1 HMGL-like-domain-containing protein [Sodiomyces alkalinus F11]
MGNGASSSNSGIRGEATHPIGHHTSHTLENGASSGSMGAHGDGQGGVGVGGEGEGVGEAEAEGEGEEDPNVKGRSSRNPGGDLETPITNPAVDMDGFNLTTLHPQLRELGECGGATERRASSACSSSAGSLARESDDGSEEGASTVATSMRSSGNLSNFSIIDSTLREGEQFATAYFTTEQKIQIARALDDFGVEYIEVTSPAASERSRADCEALCKLGLRAKILCHIRCHMDDARIAVQTGVDGINMCIGTSSQLMKHSHGKDMAYIAAKAKEVIEYVKANNIEIRFSGEDSFRSDFGEILKLYSLVDGLGANRVGIADTVGGATSFEVFDKIHALRQVVGCDIETHFHNDTGCAVSNAYVALEVGATHIDTTVLGIGERNGITSLGGLMACLAPSDRKYILNKYKIEKLEYLEQLVADIVGVEIPFNNPSASLKRLFDGTGRSFN